MHRLILRDDIPEGYEVDHIDGNSLNNRKSNLRIVTRLQNIQNSKVRIDNQIGIRGISYSKYERKYVVDFSFNNVRYYFKHWDTIEEAVYCRKFAEEYFDLHILKNNPLKDKYLDLDSDKINEIKNHTYDSINKKKFSVN